MTPAPATLPDARQRVRLVNGDAPAGELRDVHGDVYAPAAPAALKLYTVDELDAFPDPQPLVDGLLVRDSLALIVARYASYKTFFALGLGLSIGHGVPWLGRPVHAGPVAYIASEGRAGLRRRVRAWRAAHRWPPDSQFYLLPDSVQFTDPAQVARLLAALGELPAPPVAVFIDTVARNMAGNENAPEDMGAFVRGCDAVRRATGAAVVGVHHTGWTEGRSRGHTSLPGALDTEIQLTRAEGTKRVSVRITKQKDGDEGEPFDLEAVPCDQSLVLQLVQSGVGPTGPGPTPNERRCLVAVQTAAAVTGGAGATFGAALACSVLQKSSFTVALKSLAASGYLAKTGKLYHVTPAGVAALARPDGPAVQRRSNAGPTAVVQGPAAAAALEELRGWTDPDDAAYLADERAALEDPPT